MTKFILALQDKLGHKQFILVCSIFIGLTSGLLAIILKNFVHLIHNTIDESPTIFGINTMYFYPFAGILLCIFFVKYFLHGSLDRGVPDVLYEIAQKSGFLKQHKIYSQVISSGLTVGFGGSAGLEAPIVVTGAAVGSNFARFFRVSYKDRMTLLGCGAAAGIAAVFNAPIAGVAFAIEVLLAEVTTTNFIPLVTAAACGALFSNVMLHEEMLFSFPLQQPFNYTNVPYYIILGILSASISLYYARMVHLIEHFFIPFEKKIYLKYFLASFALVTLIIVFPSLFAEGYDSIRSLAENNPSKLLANTLFLNNINNEFLVLLFIGIIMLIKVFATSFTIVAGGNGGNFAPSLFVGVHLGFLFAKCINIMDFKQLPENNFTIVGMAGVLSGVMYAPLTGIFLIAETTGSYDLMIPLMIVSIISYTVVKQINTHSMETKRLADKGKIFTSNKDKNILLLLNTRELIETNIQTLLPNQKLRDIIELMSSSSRTIFAVINEKKELLGMITLYDIREYMFHEELYDKLSVKEMMKNPPVTLNLSEDMREVMNKFDDTNAWNLPVLENGKYVGFISKSGIFSKYREQLIHWST